MTIEHVARDPILDREAVRSGWPAASRFVRSMSSRAPPGRPGPGRRADRRSGRRRRGSRSADSARGTPPRSDRRGRRRARIGWSGRVTCGLRRSRSGRDVAQGSAPRRSGACRAAMRRPVAGSAVSSPNRSSCSPRPLDDAGRGRGTAPGRRASSWSRARKVRRWFHLITCQLSRSNASRSSGDRSSLWRTSSVRSGATTRKRTSRSSGGIRAWRRRIGSPSIAVHSTSKRKAIRPRTYQMQSTSARSSTARLIWDEIGPLLALVEPVAEPARAEPAGLLAAPDPDAQPEAMAAVGEQARSARRAPGRAAGGRRR